MVHWQSDKILIVLIGICSLHFNLIRSDCGASGADRGGTCAIDEIDRRLVGDDNRIESKDRRNLWRNDLNRGESRTPFQDYFESHFFLFFYF